MSFNKLKSVHIVGIGGCAASGIAELLKDNGVKVSGSELKYNNSLLYLEKKGINIKYGHSKDNLTANGTSPDLVLYSPAVMALNPDNPELLEAKSCSIVTESWQNFIGDYLNSLGKVGITVSGSEGKGTTAGVLTTILKGTSYDPLSILGAKIKFEGGVDPSNIYFGTGSTYILEGDEFNRNFHHYHPGYNLMINFCYEHPETYRDFDEYMESFYTFFMGMTQPRTLILRACQNTIEFVKKFNISKTHRIIWFGSKNLLSLIDSGEKWQIDQESTDQNGSTFVLINNKQEFSIQLSVLPAFMILNAAAAIITAIDLGLSLDTIQANLNTFKGMVRRFDVYKTINGKGRIITDYGHSPESIEHIVTETRQIFGKTPIHLIFHPHLYSRTYNFFNDFVRVLSNADKITILDIYPAREKSIEWEEKVKSLDLINAVKQKNSNVFYGGKPEEISENLSGQIDVNEITIFIGAGNMDLYYMPLIKSYTIK